MTLLMHTICTYMATWYRSVLEVLKFCSPQGAMGGETVDEVWCKAAKSRELWGCFCEQEIVLSVTEHPKETYRKWAYSQGNLVHVEPASMRVFNCRKLQWSGPIPLTTHVEVNFNSSAVLLTDTRLFLCGGVDSSRRENDSLSSAYLIDSNGVVINLERLNRSRANHALIEVNKAVYTFGGTVKERRGETVAVSERICSPFVGKNWETLPEMQSPYWGINPCKLREVIYLCGKTNSQACVQSFNTISLEFSRLCIIFNSSFIQQMCMCFYKDLLVVLQTKETTVIDVVQEQVVREKVHPGAFANGVLNPVLIGSRLWNLDYASGRPFSFDFEAALE